MESVATHQEYSVEDTRGCDGVSRSELARIVDEVEKRGPDDLRNKHAGTHLVDLAGKTYKVRSYTSIEEAQKQFELLERVSHKFVPCLGRIGRFLILKHVPGESLVAVSDPLSRVAEFLAELASEETSPISTAEFADACRDLEVAKVFGHRPQKFFKEYFRNQLSKPIRWCLQCYDAQPANFILDAHGRCLCVDEKHLVQGPCGLSLIRPLRKFAIGDYEQLSRQYCDQTNNDAYADPAYRDFVFFFYSIWILALYARCTSRGAMQKRQAMLLLRRKAMQVAKVSVSTRVWEEVRWLLPYFCNRLRSNARRRILFFPRRIGRIFTRSRQSAMQGPDRP